MQKLKLHHQQMQEKIIEGSLALKGTTVSGSFIITLKTLVNMDILYQSTMKIIQGMSHHLV